MTKIEIIEAAFKVWGRDFYLNTSLSQVALELGVSKPALYRHFRNKQALLDAMTGYFFEDFIAFILPDYQKALQEGGRKGFFTLIRAFANYYARNVYAFIFSMVRLYDPRHAKRSLTEEMRSRGLDMGKFHHEMEKSYVLHPIVMNMIFTTLTFYMALFHKKAKSFTNTPSDEEISKRIGSINEIIERGIGYIYKDISALDYEGLENRVEGTVENLEDDPLLRAVAAATAAAGPWEASMEQVARRSGLSKSGLYGHFKSKRDMLHRLFMTEFMRIIDFARQGMGRSEVPHEKLYLGIFSIAVYLRSKQDILVAMDWVRTRRHDFVKAGSASPLAQTGGAGAVGVGTGGNCDNAAWEWEDGPPPEFPKIFEDIEINPLQSGEISDGEGRKLVSHWILFLLINILMRPGETKTLKNEDIRFLYRFITLGIKGFEL